MSEHVWVTKDGTEILVSEMGGRHLMNAYKWLQREIRSYREAQSAFYHPVLGPSPGSMAEYYAEQEVETYPETIAGLRAWLEILGEEIDKREFERPEEIEPRPLPKFEFVEEYKGARIFKMK